MEACVFRGPGRVTVESRPVPSSGPSEIVLRMKAAGVCHSDIRVYKGEKPARLGVIPGHEIMGTVAALGEGVGGPSLGQRVAVCPIIACGSCYYCLRGLRNRCLRRVTLGYEEDGGLAEYALIPAPVVALGHVFPVPEGLPSALATLMEPLACVLNSLEACRQEGLHLFVLPPCSPKLNGHVERAQRTHTEEFWECYDEDLDLAAVRSALRCWENVYNTYRPHQSLAWLTPSEYLAKCHPGDGL